MRNGVRTMLGASAVNKEKDKIEGEFRTTQPVWGIIMDTQAEKAYLPERRIQKGAALVAGNEFDLRRDEGHAQADAAIQGHHDWVVVSGAGLEERAESGGQVPRW